MSTLFSPSKQELRGLNMPFIVTGVSSNDLLTARQRTFYHKSSAHNFDGKHNGKYTDGITSKLCRENC